MSSSNPAISAQNFHPVPRHIPTLLSTLSKTLKAAYALKHLPQPTYHHSLRAYNWGLSIADTFFPSWKINRETYFLACLFHDIGTIQPNITTTLLSFEFQGGIIAYNEIVSAAGGEESVRAQAEAVAEAVIRHQDIDDVGNGMITQLGSLLQLATLYDNAGANDQLVHETTLRVVVERWPRLGWSGCFKEVIREECRRKPWAHTTKIGEDNFIGLIEGNKKGNALD